jgi:hypothetical protein
MRNDALMLDACIDELTYQSMHTIIACITVAADQVGLAHRCSSATNKEGKSVAGATH